MITFEVNAVPEANGLQIIAYVNESCGNVAFVVPDNLVDLASMLQSALNAVSKNNLSSVENGEVKTHPPLLAA